MNKIILVITCLVIISCNPGKSDSPSYVLKANHNRNATVNSSYHKGSTYLSVYSQVYQRNEQRTYDLTVMASMRNTSLSDSIYIISADYYSTNGKLLTSYIKSPIYIAPMETVEIVIEEDDKRGGTGANFIFNWACKDSIQEPFFEGIMTSTTGQQGLSFVTNGMRIK